jgi:hypothetical protein
LKVQKAWDESNNEVSRQSQSSEANAPKEKKENKAKVKKA